MSKQLLGICTAVTENKLWPTVPQYEGNTCFPNTWIFYYPMRRPPLSSPWSRGGCCQLRSQSWLSVSQHMPALSITTPLLQTSGMETEKLSELGEHKAGPPQRIFGGASQLGFPNSLSLLSEGYLGKQALPVWITICSLQCTKRATSNQSGLMFFLILLKWFRLSGYQYFFLKKSREGTRYKEAVP